jgi:putative DNA primase/helicase
MNGNNEISGFDLADLGSLDPTSRDTWPQRTYRNMDEYINVTEMALRSSNLDPDSFIILELRRGLAFMRAGQIATKEDLKHAFDKDTKAGTYRIAAHLIQKHHVKTIGGTKREIFVYRDGVYIDGDDVLRAEIRELLEELCTTHHSKEIIETIKDRTAIDRDHFRVDARLINLNNGVLDINTRELKPHDPGHLFFSKIPVAYDPMADCPTIKKYLSEVLDEEQVMIIQEWFGYALYREYFIKKALICVGEGDTGKSTLISLFYTFFGDVNVSGVSLQSMSNDKFAVSNLYSKHINLHDELSFKDIRDNGAFKMATGGGIITGEKKFKSQFQFKNYAKLTFACNKIPDVKESNDDAYFNRWIVLHFSRVVEKDKQDKLLIHKITTTTELSGLLNFAIDGLVRLLERQHFTYEKEAHEIKAEMLRSSSSVAHFAFDGIEESAGAWVSKEDMYQAFKKYSHENKLPDASMKAFGSRLPMYASYITDFRPKDPKTGTQVTAWRNVKLRVRISEDFSADTFNEDEYAPDHFTS